MKLPHRRQVLHLATGAAALSAVSRITWAQAYPTRPVTLVVPIAAGGGLDTAARILAEKLQDKFQQPFIVENRPGAGTTVGTNFVAKAKPDGYTLLLMDVSAVWAKWLTKNAPFDVIGDFTPIAMFATTPLMLFAHPSFAVNDVRELVAYSKANPGKLSVGTPGVSTPHHLAAAWLNTAAKIDITHVPYRGAAPALNDLLGGQIPLIWATPVAVMPFVEQGKAKVLGVATQQRIPMLPQVPTIAESAVPGFAVDIWLGIAAPANVPPEVVVRVGQAIHEATDLPEVQKRMSTLGLYVDFRNSEQFRELIVREHQKYGMIIREPAFSRNEPGNLVNPRLTFHNVPLRDFAEANVRFGSKADILLLNRDVRFTPESGHWFHVSGCPLCAKRRHMHRTKKSIRTRTRPRSDAKLRSKLRIGHRNAAARCRSTGRNAATTLSFILCEGPTTSEIDIWSIKK